jgi:hypothetical protein
MCDNTWWSQNVFDKRSDIATDHLTRVHVRCRVVEKDKGRIGTNVVNGAQVAMSRTVERTKFYDPTNQAASLNKGIKKKLIKKEMEKKLNFKNHF